ncbi:unnamed protein product, partial [marine sediment metagenome]
IEIEVIFPLAFAGLFLSTKVLNPSVVVAGLSIAELPMSIEIARTTS